MVTNANVNSGWPTHKENMPMPTCHKEDNVWNFLKHITFPLRQEGKNNNPQKNNNSRSDRKKHIDKNAIKVTFI